MAKRTAQELAASLRGLFGDNMPDEAITMMEDLTDSVGGGIPDGYVPPETYRAMEERALKAEGDYNSMRSRYINRFYDGYDQAGERGMIMGGAVPQGEIQQEEKKITYADLFE